MEIFSFILELDIQISLTFLTCDPKNKVYTDDAVRSSSLPMLSFSLQEIE